MHHHTVREAEYYESRDPKWISMVICDNRRHFTNSKFRARIKDPVMAAISDGLQIASKSHEASMSLEGCAADYARIKREDIHDELMKY